LKTLISFLTIYFSAILLGFRAFLQMNSFLVRQLTAHRNSINPGKNSAHSWLVIPIGFY
jgi:hypothetical protein